MDSSGTCMVADVPMEWSIQGRSFHCSFRAPRRVRLHPDYENMVLDQCVATAYLVGVMPVGEVIWYDEDTTSPAGPLREGEPLPVQEMEPMMRVVMEVMI